MQDPFAALSLVLETHPELTPAEGGRVLFMRARPGVALDGFRGQLTCLQPYKPWATALQAAGLRFSKEVEGPFALVLLLPERQRQAMHADIARAHDLLAPGGALVVALPNDWGAKRTERSLAEISGNIESISKHRSRVFWAFKRDGEPWDEPKLAEWRTAGAMQKILDERFWSQPGLFSWNRIDEGSQLLVNHLPTGVRGRVADLGIGWGFLSDHLLRNCHDIDTLDGYDADADAIECARRNLGIIPTPVRPKLHWHDVTTGLGAAQYDWIITNPPFHEGRAADPMLGVKFITAAALALAPGGQLWLVANRHLPYEHVLSEAFEESKAIAESHGFKVLTASGSKIRPVAERRRKGKWKTGREKSREKRR